MPWRRLGRGTPVRAVRQKTAETLPGSPDVVRPAGPSADVGSVGASPVPPSPSTGRRRYSQPPGESPRPSCPPPAGAGPSIKRRPASNRTAPADGGGSAAKACRDIPPAGAPILPAGRSALSPAAATRRATAAPTTAIRCREGREARGDAARRVPSSRACRISASASSSLRTTARTSPRRWSLRAHRSHSSACWMWRRTPSGSGIAYSCAP